MVWDVVRISEVRTPEECFTAIQSGHILNHSKANNGQAGVGFLITRKWKAHKVTVSSISGRVSDRVLCIIKRYKLNIVKVYAPTTSYSDKDINNFYNDVDDTLGKSNHYTIVMGDFTAPIRETNVPYGNGQTKTKTKVTDMNEHVRKRKWSWTGHVSRIRDNRWTLPITTWKTYERKTHRGIAARRWRDELDEYWKGTIWLRIALDRQMWKPHAEAFGQYGCTMMMMNI